MASDGDGDGRLLGQRCREFGHRGLAGRGQVGTPDVELDDAGCEHGVDLPGDLGRGGRERRGRPSNTRRRERGRFGGCDGRRWRWVRGGRVGYGRRHRGGGGRCDARVRREAPATPATPADDRESGLVDMANADTRADQFMGPRPRRLVGKRSEQTGVTSPHADIDAVHAGGIEGANRLRFQTVLDMVAYRDERPDRKKRYPDRAKEERDASPNRFPPCVEVIQTGDLTSAAGVACAVVGRTRVGAHRSPVVPGSTPPTRCSM